MLSDASSWASSSGASVRRVTPRASAPSAASISSTSGAAAIRTTADDDRGTAARKLSATIAGSASVSLAVPACEPMSPPTHTPTAMPGGPRSTPEAPRQWPPRQLPSPRHGRSRPRRDSGPQTSRAPIGARCGDVRRSQPRASTGRRRWSALSQQRTSERRLPSPSNWTIPRSRPTRESLPAGLRLG